MAYELWRIYGHLREHLMKRVRCVEQDCAHDRWSRDDDIADSDVCVEVLVDAAPVDGDLLPDVRDEHRFHLLNEREPDLFVETRCLL